MRLSAASHVGYTAISIGVARIFSGDALSSSSFFSHHALLHGHIRQLPFLISSAGVQLTKFSPILPHSNKNAYKNIFRRPGGCTCTLCTPWLRLWPPVASLEVRPFHLLHNTIILENSIRYSIEYSISKLLDSAALHNYRLSAENNSSTIVLGLLSLGMMLHHRGARLRNRIA